MTQRSKVDLPLLSLLFLHCGASLLHFAHNAFYLHDYPNMPLSLTALGVWAAWIAVTAVGVLGYWLFAAGRKFTGLIVIAAYAALGFGGLDHYVIAPISAHSIMMNASILFEVISAALLLGLVAYRLVQMRMPSTKVR
jgi:hypothetical protein